MQNSRQLLLLIALTMLGALFLLPACGQTNRDDDDDDSAGDDDDSAGDDDDATGDDDDATGDDDDATGDDDDDDDVPDNGEMLQVHVERAIGLVAGEDGIGDVYVTVFATPPSQSKSPDIAAVSSFEMADFSAPGAVVTVPTPMPPTRPEPYAVVVFLDDDGTGAAGGPTAGDLRSAPVTFTATGDPAEVELELSQQGAPGAPNPGN